MAINTEKISSNNLMIILLLINLLVVGVTALAVKSLYTTIALDAKVNDLKAKAEKQADANVEAAPLLVEEYDNLGQKAGVLADALPNEVDFPSLIVTLENMGNLAGLQLKSITPGQSGAVVATTEGPAPADAKASETPEPQVFAFSVNFTSTYDSMTKLLKAIETSARPIRVVDVQFTGGGSGLNTQVNLQTWYQDKATLPFSTETVK